MGAVVEVDQKGRIVLPREVRNKLGLKTGDALVMDVREDKVLLELLGSEDRPTKEEVSLNDFLNLILMVEDGNCF